MTKKPKTSAAVPTGPVPAAPSKAPAAPTAEKLVSGILDSMLPGMTGPQEQQVFLGEENVEGVHGKKSKFITKTVERDISVDHVKGVVTCSRGAFVRALSKRLDADDIPHKLSREASGKSSFTYVLSY